MEDKWEEQKGKSNMWMPVKVGDTIEGAIVSMSQGQYGLSVTIENKDGQHLLPSHKVLQSRLADCKIGDMVRISFEKEELPTIKGRQGTKIYKVLKRITEPVPVEKV